MNFQAAYIPVGVGTFHMESADKAMQESIDTLKAIDPEVAVPEEKLLTLDLLRKYLAGLSPDLLVFQNLTFANSAYMSEVMHAFPDVPLVIWTLREPVIDGGRLRLNSLTGAYSAANLVRAFTDRKFVYIYGAATEEKVKTTLAHAVSAARLRKEMQSLTISAVGHTPEGFGFGRALDQDLLKTFGVRLSSIEARELIHTAESYSEEEIRPYLEKACKATVALDQIPEKNQLGFARLYKAYSDYVTKNHIGALASRCWPDFFTSFGTPVCMVLAMLNDMGVAAACEADTYGALSMWCGMKLSHQAVFFGDPVSLDEEKNTVTFWHCGTAACSLAREDTGARVGVHCNRKIGPTLEFGTKPSKDAVIFRIGRKADGTFRFLIAKGSCLDMPQQFYGTSSVIQLQTSAEDFVKETVQDGWEPHYVVIYEDTAEELKMLGDMLGIEVKEY